MRALAGTTPAKHALAAEQVANSGNRAHIVELALGIPSGDAGVENGVGQREEELDALSQVELIAFSHKGGEFGPVTRRQFGIGAVGPVFGDYFLFRGQVRLDVHHVFGLVQVSLTQR
ncbi:MAG: hypothetical protein IPJ38_16935 [Dechloromonas sp.]|uniref:Uncharacterized protein n=1 Tax=Candidatus Dechloromonas phosphorivorans TaxID=2899244 RepID=A0A935K6K8_9RHOO|nr:hypothetical protein [Candidatus Dechloromonas phosphorivorans]